MLNIAIQNQFDNLILTEKADAVYFGERFCIEKFINSYALIEKFGKKAKEANVKTILVVPGIVPEINFSQVSDLVLRSLDFIDGILSSDYGICYHLRKKCNVIYEGKVFNRLFLDQLTTTLNVKKIRISPPYLNLIKKIKRRDVEFEIYAHGLIPIAGFAECLTKSLYGCDNCNQGSEIKNIYGTFILSGRTLRSSIDICCFDIIDQLEEFGIKSLVIETYGKQISAVENLIDIYKRKSCGALNQVAHCNGIFLGDDTSVQLSGIWQKDYCEINKRLNKASL